MKLWNLSDLSELETSVLSPYGEAAAPRIGRERQRSGPVIIRIGLGIAVLTAAFSIGAIQSNASTSFIPRSAMVVARSVAEPSPPLEEFFRGGFTSEWSEELENELLMKVETSRLQSTSASLADQTIDTVFSNQLEDLSGTSNKLTREQIGRLVKNRKSR